MMEQYNKLTEYKENLEESGKDVAESIKFIADNLSTSKEILESSLAELKIREALVLEQRFVLNTSKQEIENMYNKGLQLVADAESLLERVVGASLGLKERAVALDSKDKELKQLQSNLHVKETDLENREVVFRSERDALDADKKSYEEALQQRDMEWEDKRKKLETYSDILETREKGLVMRENSLEDVERAKEQEERRIKDREKLSQA